MSDILDEEYEELPEKEPVTFKSMVKFEDEVERYTFVSCFIPIVVLSLILFSICVTCVA